MRSEEVVSRKKDFNALHKFAEKEVPKCLHPPFFKFPSPSLFMHVSYKKSAH